MDVLQTIKKLLIKEKTGNAISGAESVILSLYNEEVNTIFGYPGGAIMPIYDELYKYKDYLKHILVRHEQGAIHAAQGYARVSGKVGVVFATSGPGATNLLTGIADALIDSTPVVCITGQVASHLLGTDAFQEVDVMNTSSPITKWNMQITRAKDIPQIIKQAFYVAKSGRPGPVLIDITKDAQFENCEFVLQEDYNLPFYKTRPTPNKTELDKAIEVINQAERPYILCGQGVVLGDAVNELLAFAEKGNIPIASTLLGLSTVPVDHPMYVGYLGMHGNYGPNVNTNNCDVLIGIGMRFDDRVTGVVSKYAKQAKVVHIELDRSEISKNVFTHYPVHADCKEALAYMTQKIESKDRSKWLQSFKEYDKIEKEKVLNFEFAKTSDKIKMAEVVHLISKKTGGKAVVVTDVGQHQMVTSRYFEFKRPRTNITSGGMGTMGFALPAAMGACFGENEFPVIAVIGDGGYQMTIQELGTIMEYRIPVKIVILNNNFLGMVRQWQQLFFEKRYSFVDMANPDFIKIAEAYSIDACRITKRSEIESGIQQMLNAPEAFVLEVLVEKEENVFPMVPTGSGVGDIILEPSSLKG